MLWRQEARSTPALKKVALPRHAEPGYGSRMAPNAAVSRHFLAPLTVAVLILGTFFSVFGFAGPAFAEPTASPAPSTHGDENTGANGEADDSNASPNGLRAAPPTVDGKLDAADFDPAFIISDYNFFNAHAMTEKQIQEFLESQNCVSRDDSPCLADYRQDTPSEPAGDPGGCTAYVGADDEPASRIIAKAALACRVSPRVLLVTLQKEQTLITRPNASGYRHATGYGCPDTAACDSNYYGFFNQVYAAARQFRNYTQHPDRRYHVGPVEVRYHPNVSCRASVLDIKNQATANLYNYTPYQPDASAVESLGHGGSCSSYGNLNFWKMYTQWFGSSTWVPYPALEDSCLNLVGGVPCRQVLPLPAS